MALIAAGVALGAAMFARVASESPSRHSLWLRVPFSLHFGAMTIALLIALAQWMNAGGRLATNALAPDELTAAFLAIAVLAGGYVALRYSDFVYPAVIAWGTGAIFVAQRAQDPYVAAAALAVCVGMLVVAGLAAATQARTPRSDARDKPSRPHQGEERAKEAEFVGIQPGRKLVDHAALTIRPGVHILETPMNEETFNMSIRKFLKMVGVTSQREIEQAVAKAIASGAAKGTEVVSRAR